jgi:hypothetical protein
VRRLFPLAANDLSVIQTSFNRSITIALSPSPVTFANLLLVQLRHPTSTLNLQPRRPLHCHLPYSHTPRRWALFPPPSIEHRTNGIGHLCYDQSPLRPLLFIDILTPHRRSRQPTTWTSWMPYPTVTVLGLLLHTPLPLPISGYLHSTLERPSINRPTLNDRNPHWKSNVVDMP